MVIPLLSKQGTATPLRSGEGHVVTYIEREGQPAELTGCQQNQYLHLFLNRLEIFPFQTKGFQT